MFTFAEFQVGSSIYKVLAEDEDQIGNIRYGSQGIAPAPAYFGINPATGEINITQSLLTDRRTSYTVSI